MHRWTPVTKLPTLAAASRIKISLTTLKKCMATNGFVQSKVVYKAFLEKQHRHARYPYALAHQNINFQKGIYADKAIVRANGNHACIWAVCGLHYGLGAIYHGRRSELVIFDISKSTGKQGGVTAQLYQEQIVNKHFKNLWESAISTVDGEQGPSS
ncbi:hypothetical protein I350_04162 [Cryptococcus amylolentus CBS 6273]|uniref:Uncharacterized protein n=1 Tax=Cryptococcus amylolentus CBS 6273 TaxID=1296118 RepID=A0A1E3K3M9_9TREE|nr:hypothetical protein I350_04162 [Cryptococcus amylolentus CBS 6273]